jgi:hypothetical protein
MIESPMRARFRLVVPALSGVALTLVLALPASAKPPAKAARPAAPATKTDEAPAKEAAPEPTVKAAGTQATKEQPKGDGKTARVVEVEESKKDEGVKTYKFSAVEVEGRLRSPQIAYFLRRVRAEFEAGDLGHRSFMPELSDTRRSPSLR